MSTTNETRSEKSVQTGLIYHSIPHRNLLQCRLTVKRMPTIIYYYTLTVPSEGNGRRTPGDNILLNSSPNIQVIICLIVFSWSRMPYQSPFYSAVFRKEKWSENLSVHWYYINLFYILIYTVNRWKLMIFIESRWKSSRSNLETSAQLAPACARERGRFFEGTIGCCMSRWAIYSSGKRLRIFSIVAKFSFEGSRQSLSIYSILIWYLGRWLRRAIFGLQPASDRRKIQDPASNEFDYYLAIKVSAAYTHCINFRLIGYDVLEFELIFLLFRIPVVRIGRLAGQFAKPRYINILSLIIP